MIRQSKSGPADKNPSPPIYRSSSRPSLNLSSIIPFIISGLRLGVGRALIGVMVGELYAATAGIGFMITVAGATFQTDKVFVGVMIFAITGMVSMEILGRFERRFEKWRPGVGATQETRC